MPEKEWAWLTEFGSTNPYRRRENEGYSFDFYDTTLRDGEQQAAVFLSEDEKVRIFRALEKAGIQYIETGMIAVSEEEELVVKQLAAEGHDSRVFVLARCMAEDIVKASECGADGVQLEIISNRQLAEKVFGWSEDDIKDRAISALRKTKEVGLDVGFFLIDATRADQDWLCMFADQLVSDGGVDFIAIADSFGVCDEEGMRTITTRLKGAVEVPIHVHCHNDYGLATANSLAALSAGAKVVQGTFNGLGERAGNMSVPEVAVAAKYLKGWSPNINLLELRRVSKIVADLTRAPLCWNQPIVGEHLFDMESGIVAMIYEALQDDLRLAYAFLPSMVDAEPKIVLGRGSGVASVRLALKQMGLEQVDESKQRELVAKCKQLGIEKHRALTGSEFRQLVESTVSGV